MTVTWPRLPMAQASSLMQQIREGEVPQAGLESPLQTYAAVGERARSETVATLRAAMLSRAADFGFPVSHPGSRELTDFDRAAGEVLAELMDITWSEASSRDMWNFVALVVLPDVTRWRWRDSTNEERWLARDLVRHAWARLWWQATTFRGHEDVLAAFRESELNQFFERREIGGRPELVIALASSLLAVTDGGDTNRRLVIRDVTKRTLRTLAYVDTTSMTPQQIREMTDRLVADSVAALSARAPAVEWLEPPAPPRSSRRGLLDRLRGRG